MSRLIFVLSWFLVNCNPMLLVELLFLSSFPLWRRRSFSLFQKSFLFAQIHTWSFSRNNSLMGPLKKNKSQGFWRFDLSCSLHPKRKEKKSNRQSPCQNITSCSAASRRQHHVTYCTNVWNLAARPTGKKQAQELRSRQEIKLLLI